MWFLLPTVIFLLPRAIQLAVVWVILYLSDLEKTYFLPGQGEITNFFDLHNSSRSELPRQARIPHWPTSSLEASLLLSRNALAAINGSALDVSFWEMLPKRVGAVYLKPITSETDSWHFALIKPAMRRGRPRFMQAMEYC